MTTTWSRDEILKLIEVWVMKIIQAQLNCCKHNQDIFDKILSALLEAGFRKNGSQCRDTINPLYTIVQIITSLQSYDNRAYLHGLLARLSPRV